MNRSFITLNHVDFMAFLGRLAKSPDENVASAAKQLRTTINKERNAVDEYPDAYSMIAGVYGIQVRRMYRTGDPVKINGELFTVTDCSLVNGLKGPAFIANVEKGWPLPLDKNGVMVENKINSG